MAKLSSTATAIITLLNNINELLFHHRRAEAVDVMRALKVYAINRNFTISEEKVENFYSVIHDARSDTLVSLLLDISQEVLHNDKQY